VAKKQWTGNIKCKKCEEINIEEFSVAAYMLDEDSLGKPTNWIRIEVRSICCDVEIANFEIPLPEWIERISK